MCRFILGFFLLGIFLQGSFGNVVYQCDFETPTCNLKLINDTNDFHWNTHKGPTKSQDTGPDTDHTQQTDEGVYFYAEITNIEVGSLAAFTLPDLGTGPFCLTFWYHMYGQHIGELTVNETTSSGMRTIWSMERDQGNVWLQANVSLSAGIQTVAFSTIRGGGDISQPFGDIAVDDIMVTDIEDGYCTIETTTEELTTESQTTEVQTTENPTTESPTTESPTTESPTTESPTTKAETTETPTTTTTPTPSTSTTSTITTTTTPAPTTTTTTSTTTSSTTSTTAPTTTPTTTSTASTTESSTSNDVVFTTSSDASGDMHTTTPESSVSEDMTTEDWSSKATCPPPSNSDSSKEELWGVDETSWIIILAVMGGVIILLLIVVIVQACALNKMRSARITKKSQDYDNIREYNKYNNAYDNLGLETEGANGKVSDISYHEPV